jgi:hypothetical protein
LRISVSFFAPRTTFYQMVKRRRTARGAVVLESAGENAANLPNGEILPHIAARIDQIIKRSAVMVAATVCCAAMLAVRRDCA